jgi:hypothetical protein
MQFLLEQVRDYSDAATSSGKETRDFERKEHRWEIKGRRIKRRGRNRIQKNSNRRTRRRPTSNLKKQLKRVDQYGFLSLRDMETAGSILGIKCKTR